MTSYGHFFYIFYICLGYIFKPCCSQNRVLLNNVTENLCILYTFKIFKIRSTGPGGTDT